MATAGRERKQVARAAEGGPVMEGPVIGNPDPPRSCAHCEFHAEHFSTCCRVLRDLAGPGSGDVPQAEGGKGAGGGRRGGCYRRPERPGPAGGGAVLPPGRPKPPSAPT